MPKRSAARTEFLGDIISTAIEGGVGYWSECSHYQYVYDGKLSVCVGAHVPGEDRSDPYAVIHELDEGGDTIEGSEPLTIDVETIARGINLILKNKMVNSRIEQDIREADRENDAGMIDSDDADCIVQAGLFGEVRYG